MTAYRFFSIQKCSC